MTHRLGPIVDGILASYQEIGGINHIEGARLPSRTQMLRVIEDLEAIIFPGYHEEETGRTENLKYSVAERVSRVGRNLTEEVQKCLCFQRGLDTDDLCSRRKHDQEIEGCHERAETITSTLLEMIPELRRRIRMDVEAAFDGDPAASSKEEVILAYPGIEAVLIHRVAHELFQMEVPLLPRMMSEYVHGKTGIDIHPGATIGDYFFIDHATGVVIGETTVIGNHVKIYQGVTIGALSVKKDEANRKRHPTIEDHVTIYAGATILGGNTVIGQCSVIGGNVWITDSVPPNSQVFYRGDEFSVTRSRVRRAG
ncbi:MAG: serine acetyltransferase [Spirochaetaceae bacterium]|nr:MAG: serine acetyltransferase [Spirochaetaceae bacterium]